MTTHTTHPPPARAKLTRDSFIHCEHGGMWDFGPNPPEPLLFIGISGRTDGWEATAIWHKEGRMLICVGKTMEQAQDALLESLGAPPPPGKKYLFFAREKP